ncbi:MAG: hypothetical protein ABJK25_14395 [Halieaceae bacterium]
MNWEVVGAVAELIGSLVVLVTLLFVVVQLRHSSSAIRSGSLQNALNADVGIMTALVSDPELYEIYYQGIRSSDALSKKEYGRFEILMLLMMRHIDIQYQQYQDGETDSEYWESLATTFRGQLSMPGAFASWQRQKGVFSKSFVSEVDSWNVTPNKSSHSDASEAGAPA